MKTLSKKVVMALICMLLLTGFYFPKQSKTSVETIGQECKKPHKIILVKDSTSNQKPYLQVQYWTIHYAKKYNVPERYLFKLLKIETGYLSTDASYNPYKKEMVSRDGARGPFQILPSTARIVWKDSLSKMPTHQIAHKLQFDIEFNVHTAVKHLATLYAKYGNWKKVFGAYNTGHPVINRYSMRITSL